MIQTKTLAPGVTLRLYRDSRFKQGCLSFQLLRPMCSEESAQNALLPNLLLRGTKNHPDLRSITARLDTLYGAAISPLVRRIGDCQCTGLFCGFMDDRFALPGDKVLGPMLAFLEEALLDPLTEGEGFVPGLVESEKKNLIAAIESELNDKRTYAMGKLLKIMCSGDSFGLPRLGEPEQVAAITSEGLYAHYRRILKTSPIDIFYVGSGDLETVAEGLAPLLSRLERQVTTLPPQTGFSGGQGQSVTEQMDVAQGKLCMGFTTPITNRDPEFPAMQVANTILGAGMTSKLFVNIREKMSLCYSIGSGYYGTKGIVAVNAGIDFDKVEIVKDQVLRQAEACRKGDISQQELCAAKQALLSSLRATQDSPGSIESFYATAAVSGLGLTPQQYMAAIEAVDIPQVTAAAKTLTLHTTYFLKGTEQ